MRQQQSLAEIHIEQLYTENNKQHHRLFARTALAEQALVVPLLKSRPQVVAALAGGAAGVVLYALPLKLGLIVACAVGTTVGLAVDALLARRAQAGAAP